MGETQVLSVTSDSSSPLDVVLHLRLQIVVL